MKNLARLTFVLLLPACGETSTTVECQPACPAPLRCTERGCVSDASDGGAPDLATSLGDAGGCREPCQGATPVCNASGNCVGCAADADCPIGTTCRVLSPQSALCAPGCNDDARCGGGAKHCCGGQCLDTTADSRNCGGCGVTCVTPHSGASCVGGRCTAGLCQMGWGDCNADPLDGCETPLRTDPKNCGACGMACAMPHGIAGCDNAGCYLASCLYGFDDCNADPKDGCEVAVSSDLRNCGGCNVVCPNVPHAKGACANGACLLASCDAGFADCDGNPVNGCEVALANDARNCGACGFACGAKQVCVNSSCTCQQCNIPNARTKCINLVCTLDSCLPGFADCNANVNDGCEVDLTSDAKNCGGCGLPCGAKLPYCQAGVCSNITPSCADILKGNPGTQSGVYAIDPDGNGPNPAYAAYCDMTTDGGGWTAFFSGLNGSPNVFNHFEDTAVDCNDPATRCLRRLPGNVNQGSQFLATCGNASLRFTVSPATYTYFATGVQGGTWIGNANQVAVGGGANPAFAQNTWTGQGANKGWIISAGDRQQLSTFSSSYNLNAQWDYCNGQPDVASPVRLYYR